MIDEHERPYHKVANIFPLMHGEDYEALKADIAANGQMEPIWLHPDGSIIDGRNRHRACLDLGIQPQFRTWGGGGSLLAFVASLNLHRRHLSSSQRAAIATDIEPMLAEEARERQAHGQTAPGVTLKEIFPEASNGQARDQAAEIMGTNGRYVSDAKRIKQESPELFEQVKAGVVTIPQARREMAQPRREMVWTQDQAERRTAVLRGETVLANKKHDHQLVDWARETGRLVHIDRGTIWGNPFILDADGNRETVVEKYSVYYDMKNSLWPKIGELRGKVLACWCYPELCHGNVLMEEIGE